jgi:very-short-patch-repair endonuclease
MRGLHLHETRRSRELRQEQSEAERQLWRRLRGRLLGGFKFVRQEPIGPYFADFVCREEQLILEVDGATHSTDEERRRDAKREEFLRERGHSDCSVRQRRGLPQYGGRPGNDFGSVGAAHDAVRRPAANRPRPSP